MHERQQNLRGPGVEAAVECKGLGGGRVDECKGLARLGGRVEPNAQGGEG